MKTLNTIVKTAALGLAVIVTLVMAAGCFSALTPPVSNSGAIPAGKGALTISIAGADARTIFPDMSGFTYNASFTSGTTVISTGSLVANAANNFYLDPGTWKVDIYATGTIATTPAVLTAVIGAAHIPAIVITAGQTTECTNIQVLPVTQDPSTQATLDNGTLSWSVSFPEDLDTAKLYYGLYGETPTDVDLLQQAATDQSTSLSGSISLVPGTYLVNSHLEKDSLVAGNAEAVHIYAGQTSSINWQYFAASFVDTKSLAGSVNITCSDTIESIQSVVLNIPGVQPISLVKDGSDPAVYSFSDIHIPNSIDTVTGTLTITTDTNIVTVPVSIAYSENLVLDPVHISALEATIGANGSLLIDGVEKTGNYRVDIADGTEISLEAVPDEHYRIDTFTVNGTDFSGASYTISGDTDIEVSFVLDLTLNSITITKSGETDPLTEIVFSDTPWTVQLAASLDPPEYPGTVAWSSDDPSIASVSSDGLVTANDIGNTIISASLAGVSSSVAVQVTVSPTLIWEWHYDTDGWVTGDVTAGTVGATKVNGKDVVAIATDATATDSGVSFQRLAFGSTKTANTANGAGGYDTAGEFNFDGTRLIRITAGYMVKTVPTTNRTMRIMISNNTNNANSDFIPGAATQTSVIYPSVAGSYALGTNNVSTTAGAHTLVGIFDPNEVTVIPTGVNLSTILAHSFIGITLQSPAGYDGDIYLTSIKVEYVNPVWQWTDNWVNVTSAAPVVVNGKTVTIKNTAANANTDTANPGIIINAASNAAFLIIGSEDPTATSTTHWDSTAEFDFTKAVRISVEVKRLDATPAIPANGFTVAVNNNTQTAANGVINASWLRKTEADIPALSVNAPVVISYDFIPANLTLAGDPGATKDQILKNSFISLLALTPSPRLLVSSIKVIPLEN